MKTLIAVSISVALTGCATSVDTPAGKFTLLDAIKEDFGILVHGGQSSIAREDLWNVGPFREGCRFDKETGQPINAPCADYRQVNNKFGKERGGFHWMRAGGYYFDVAPVDPAEWQALVATVPDDVNLQIHEKSSLPQFYCAFESGEKTPMKSYWGCAPVHDGVRTIHVAAGDTVTLEHELCHNDGRIDCHDKYKALGLDNPYLHD